MTALGDAEADSAPYDRTVVGEFDPDKGSEDGTGPGVATTLDWSSVFNGAGRKLDIDGGPLQDGDEPQSFLIAVQNLSQLKQFLLPVGPAAL